MALSCQKVSTLDKIPISEPILTNKKNQEKKIGKRKETKVGSRDFEAFTRSKPRVHVLLVNNKLKPNLMPLNFYPAHHPPVGTEGKLLWGRCKGREELPL